MVIDVRDIEKDIDLLKKLKEVLASYCGKEVSIEILINFSQNPSRVMAFASMSGCQAELEEKEGYYLVRIAGNVCSI